MGFKQHVSLPFFQSYTRHYIHAIACSAIAVKTPYLSPLARGRPMAIRGFAGALRLARRVKQMSQEDFDGASSRIYISELERGIKNPTLNKIEEIAGVLEIHPLTLCLLAYVNEGEDMAALEKLQQRVSSEARKLLSQNQ